VKASKALDKKSVIKSRIRGYIEFWERGMAKCEGFLRDFPPYIEYWRTLLEELEKPLPHGYGHGIMSHCDQAVSALAKKNVCYIDFR
jgi:hypothetical protein